MEQMNFVRPRAAGWLGAACALLAASWIAGCGGGGSEALPATGSTAAPSSVAFTSGPVGGFGSVIVNGVRFDDSGAKVDDDDGNAATSAALKLGMMVDVDSGTVDDSLGRAVAQHIRFGSALIGPVASVDTTAATFVVLGQTVEVRSATVFDDSLAGGVAGLAGKTVEVHALFDATSGHFIASRIEAAAAPVAFKLVGLVSALDTTAKTFQIGSAVVSYGKVAAADLPAALAALANGLRVRVRLETAQASGQWVAISVRSGVRKVDDRADGRLRGLVTAFTSATAFEVGGVPVDASKAVVEHGPVALGSRVDVRGKLASGTLVATRVSVLRDNDDTVRGIELHGAVSDVNTTTKTFVLRTVRVSYDASVVFKNGTEAKLVNGAQVEVKGVLSIDQKTLAAAKIEFEN